MATVGWSASGVIHYNFLCPGETTTAENTGQSKRPILLHDNVRPHVSQMILQKLNELGKLNKNFRISSKKLRNYILLLFYPLGNGRDRSASAVAPLDERSLIAQLEEENSLMIREMARLESQYFLFGANIAKIKELECPTRRFPVVENANINFIDNNERNSEERDSKRHKLRIKAWGRATGSRTDSGSLKALTFYRL
uniref:DDE-1 domain-containing protein n=1 Tax=Heterorhabditis bacteriophora TaxID=37862 RepID=A0A1I7XIU8_HETBA